MSITATEVAPNSTWRLEVNTGDESTPAWTPVAGLNNFVPGSAYTTQDSSDFNSGLYGSDAVTQVKKNLTAAFLRKNDGTAYDAGQEALKSAAEDATLAHVRWYDTAIDDGEAYEGHGYVQWAPQGGAGTGLQIVNVTVNIQGRPTVATITP